MTIDLTQVHDAFFEESFEALDSMEAALLKLSSKKASWNCVRSIVMEPSRQPLRPREV